MGVSVTDNTTGTAVMYVQSEKDVHARGTCLLAADQAWEDCDPAQRHREEKAAESLDSRGNGKKKKNKERDRALAQNKRCQEPAPRRLLPSRDGGRGGRHRKSDSTQRELFKG